MPNISKYDGATNFGDHVIAYTIEIEGNDLTKSEIESMFVKKFGETLKIEHEPGITYFPKTQLALFHNLSKSLLRCTSEHRKLTIEWKLSSKSRKETISYSENSLIDFRERMLLPQIPNNWITIAFTKISMTEALKLLENGSKIYMNSHQ